MNVFRALANSRKVRVALGGLVVAVFVVLSGDALTEEQAADLLKLITVMASTLIGGIALEDAAEKRSRG